MRSPASQTTPVLFVPVLLVPVLFDHVLFVPVFVDPVVNIPVVAVAVTDPVLPPAVCKAKVNDPGLVNVYDNELLLLTANTPAILNPVAVAVTVVPLTYDTEAVMPVNTIGGVIVPDEQLANIPVVAVTVTDPVLPGAVCSTNVNVPAPVNAYVNKPLLLLTDTPDTLNPVTVAVTWPDVHVEYIPVPVMPVNIVCVPVLWLATTTVLSPLISSSSISYTLTVYVPLCLICKDSGDVFTPISGEIKLINPPNGRV